jgi:hypothetical protein
MDFADLFRVLYRRKLVVIPMVVFAIGSMMLVYKRKPPDYKANGSVVLLAPPPPPLAATGAGAVNGQNPYLRFGDLSVVVDILARVVSSPPVGSALRAQGLKGTYVVGANIAFYHGPIIDVTAKGPTSPDAVHAAVLVMNEIGHDLAAMQTKQGANPAYLIKTQNVVTPTAAKKVFSSTFRTLIGVGVLNLIAILVVAMLADAIARGRSRRPGAAEAAETSQAGRLVPVEEPNHHVEPASAVVSSAVQPSDRGPVVDLATGGLKMTTPGRRQMASTHAGRQARRPY